MAFLNPALISAMQQSPVLPEHKSVIPPPPIGDEDIYTEAPNPEARHEKEVIPPLTPEEEQGTTEPNGHR